MSNQIAPAEQLEPPAFFVVSSKKAPPASLVNPNSSPNVVIQPDAPFAPNSSRPYPDAPFNPITPRNLNTAPTGNQPESPYQIEKHSPLTEVGDWDEWYYANFKPGLITMIVIIVIGAFFCPFFGLISIILFVYAKVHDRSARKQDPMLTRSEGCWNTSLHCAIAAIVAGIILYAMITVLIILYFTSGIPGLLSTT